MAIPVRPSSPTTVVMPPIRRFGLLVSGNTSKCYDYYGTMNAMEWHRNYSTMFSWDAAQLNIDSISRIRFGEATMMNAAFYDPRGNPEVPPGQLRCMPNRMFWQLFGVEVPLSNWSRQEFEESAEFEDAMVDAADAVEAAHALWNLWDDGVASQAPTDEVTLSEEEREALMNEDIGDVIPEEDSTAEAGTAIIENVEHVFRPEAIYPRAPDQEPMGMLVEIEENGSVVVEPAEDTFQDLLDMAPEHGVDEN